MGNFNSAWLLLFLIACDSGIGDRLPQGDERQVPGLFVKQLVKIEDITEIVKAGTDQATTDEAFQVAQQAALQTAQAEYQNKAGWEGLELETVTYYSGGRYSIYGYKRYDDVRLVLIP